MAAKISTNVKTMYAEALAERFTLPKRGKPAEATNWEEPILDTIADRVGKGMAVFFTADDGHLSFRAVTPAEAAEVVAHVRDAELERLRVQVADYERQLEQLAAELTQIRASGKVLVRREDLKTALPFVRSCVVTHPENWRTDLAETGRDALQRMDAVLDDQQDGADRG